MKSRKVGAQPGNKNASREKRGARLGALSSTLVGAAGAVGSGMYVGATKSDRAIKRHNTAAGTSGATLGAIVGGLHAGVGGAIGGAAVGAALTYAGAKIGVRLGKRINRKNAK